MWGKDLHIMIKTHFKGVEKSKVPKLTQIPGQEHSSVAQSEKNP